MKITCIKKKTFSFKLLIVSYHKNGCYRNRVGGYGLDSSGTEQGPMAGSCEYGYKPSGLIKGRDFFDYLSDYFVSGKTPQNCIIHLIHTKYKSILYFFLNFNMFVEKKIKKKH